MMHPPPTERDAPETCVPCAAGNDLFLRACRRLPTERPPVWMMRQAGRYLPEFRAVRRRADFLTMCRTPELAAELTLQPVERFGVDVAIVFSDILVVPEAMGLTLQVDEAVGPTLDAPVRSTADLARLRDPVPEEAYAPVLDAIRLATRALDGRVPLIGFAGAPWTLAAYMLEGSGTKHFQQAKRVLVGAPALAHALLARLARAVVGSLVAQVRAGAQAVQLFESWAGALSPADFRTFALPYLAEVVRQLRSTGVPVIVFAPGAPWALDEIAAATCADVLGLDWHVEAGAGRAIAERHGVAVQGNLDPCVLHAPAAEIRARTRAMLRGLAGRGHIANLGHGILPDVPVDGARVFIETVQEWSVTRAHDDVRALS